MTLRRLVRPALCGVLVLAVAACGGGGDGATAAACAPAAAHEDGEAGEAARSVATAEDHEPDAISPADAELVERLRAAELSVGQVAARSATVPQPLTRTPEQARAAVEAPSSPHASAAPGCDSEDTAAEHAPEEHAEPAGH